MFRTLAVGSIVASSLVFAGSVQAQPRPGMVHACTPYGVVGWIDQHMPEYRLGHVFACPEPGPTDAPPTPEYPPEIQGHLEVGKYYKAPYGQVYKVIGIVSPIKHPEPTWLLQQVTAQGGICGYLSYIPMSHSHAANALDEVAPREPDSTCPIAGDVDR